jgi:RNase H-fold protein (predicted Holliday junction resolvase)
MSYLAIDLGNKRCGIAVSRENIAFPETTIMRTELLSWLKKYFKINSEIEVVVV